MDLSGLPILDGHAHPVLRPEHAARLDFGSFFTEGTDPTAGRDTLFFRRSRRDLAELLECSPEEVEVRRGALPLEELARRSLEGFEALLLDDGLDRERTFDLDWHGRFAPTRRVLRIEALAEDLAGEDYGAFRDRFVAALEDAPAAAFKTIAAYRGGLRVEEPGASEATTAYEAFRRLPSRRLDGRFRPLRDHLLGLALEVARSRGLPVQVHTGFGDADLDLREADPLHLQPILERGNRLVLLHTWPYARQAAWLASVYPGAWVDFGLAVPFLSVAGMRATVQELLELAPLGKVLFSTDASRIPELFWLGARWGRRVLGEVLEECVADGDLSAREAEEAAGRILAGNARALYQR